MRTPTSLVVIAAALCSCTFTGTSGKKITDDQLAQLHDGMTREQVEDLLGSPQLVEREGRRVVLKYSYATVRGGMFTESKANVEYTSFVFVDGLLTEMPERQTTQTKQ